ncbi:RHS repeat-associated core domain-containing protein, partial [Chryseobacterium sp. P1-3]|uniref:RHS repeat-associated core domain-containing protein n=1 Tax=Chryseobacterium sp. (strain P1-3) TaxID=1517683 RepID=UPI0029345B08
MDQLCYQYKYDKYNRLAEKKLPGKEWEYVVYDKQNRPVLSQDGNLRTTTNNFGKKGWMFIKYDALGRMAYSGFFANTGTRVSMQAALDNMASNPNNNETTSTIPFSLNGIDVYYTKNAFPTESMTVLSVNYYDEYPAGSPALPTQIQSQVTLGSMPTPITSNGWSSIRSIKTLPTASYVKNIENDSWSSAFIWYDTQGRVIGTYGKNHLGGFTRTEGVLDFSGKTLETYTYHSRNTSSTEVSVKDRFVYSSQNYLSKHYQQINDNPEELISEYFYNDLGQVISKKVGNSLQSIDYTYNIRGWLTGINPDNIANLGNKLFSYKIKYNTVEGAESPNNSYSSLKVKPNYNGSIAEVDWKTAYGTNEPLRRYGYVYDGASRLRAGFYQVSTNPYSKEYSEVMNYDLNGNISSLNRTGAAVGGTAEVMDDLRYTYFNGNRLAYVEESGSGNALSGYPLGAGQGQNIDYDGNGNMTSHLDKGITKIAYNYLNLPSSFTNTDASKNISYVYLADGSKVQAFSNGKVTDYLDGFQYESTGGTLTTKILANEEGYFDFMNNRYVYQYADHLGNIRLSYTKNTNGTATILEENNYYPFGLKHTGYNTGDTTNNKFKYLYNSKELQSSGNLDYGWRQYMPDLGRWFGMDALSESYHMASPYAYVMNNPAMFFDPNGMLSQAFMDEVWNSPSGTVWTNNGKGFTNNWGGSMDYDGNPLNYFGYSHMTTGLDEGGGGGGGFYFTVPVTVTGKGNISTWNKGDNYFPNIFAMGMAFDRALAGLFPNGGRAFDSMSWVRNDRGVEMMSSVWDAVGIAIANNISAENQTQALGLAALAVILTKGKAAPGIIKTEGWLAYHEGSTLGHTLARHVGKTDADLISRLATQKGITGASSFTNEAIAE